MTRKKSQSIRDQALEIFRERGGILSTSEAMRAGIHPRILSELKDLGVLVQLEAGLYSLADLPLKTDPDLMPIAKKVPNGIVCLISALYFHHMTVQISQ